MTPEQLARDAIRVIDRLEASAVRALLAHLAMVERDAIDALARLDLRAESTRRTVLELRARDTVRQTTAARQLLSLGHATGPLASEFRAGIAAAFDEGLASAQRAAITTGALTAAEVAAVTAFGARVDLDLIASITRQTLTTLERVGADGLRRIEDAVVRGSIRGAGPRATARLVREAVDVTRYEGERIARTVFMRANNDARTEAFRDMAVDYVQHNAANDDRTCSYCEARHGMVYRLADAPDPTLHPNCRCVHVPWREDMRNRADDYFERTRAEMRHRREDEGRAGTIATARAPFERMEDRDPPAPVWAPGRGWL